MGDPLTDALKKVTNSLEKTFKSMVDKLLKNLQNAFMGLSKVFGLLLNPIIKIFPIIFGKLWGVVTNIVPILEYIHIFFFMSMMMPIIIPLIIISMAFSFVFGKYILLLPFIFMIIIPIICAIMLQNSLVKLAGVNWPKKIEEILKDSKDIIGDITKIISKEISDLFKKI